MASTRSINKGLRHGSVLIRGNGGSIPPASTCKQCGDRFNKTSGNQRYCSPTCLKESRRNARKNWNNNRSPNRKIKWTPLVIECPVCGVVFTQTTRQHRYCTPICKNKVNVKRWRDAGNKQKKKNKQPKLWVELIITQCQDCGDVLLTNNRNTKYCVSCRRIRARDYYRKNTPDRTCVICGGIIPAGSLNKKLCSDECKRINKARADRNKTPKKRVRDNMSQYVRNVLHGRKNHSKTFDLLGYTKQDLFDRLESTFTDSMSWDNYGDYWEIDHIVPESYFHYESPNDIQFVLCWGLENLQALKKEDNWAKGDNVFSRPQDTSRLIVSHTQWVANDSYIDKDLYDLYRSGSLTLTYISDIHGVHQIGTHK